VPDAQVAGGGNGARRPAGAAGFRSGAGKKSLRGKADDHEGSAQTSTARRPPQYRGEGPAGGGRRSGGRVRTELPADLSRRVSGSVEGSGRRARRRPLLSSRRVPLPAPGRRKARGPMASGEKEDSPARPLPPE